MSNPNNGNQIHNATTAAGRQPTWGISDERAFPRRGKSAVPFKNYTLEPVSGPRVSRTRPGTVQRGWPSIGPRRERNASAHTAHSIRASPQRDVYFAKLNRFLNATISSPFQSSITNGTRTPNTTAPIMYPAGPLVHAIRVTRTTPTKCSIAMKKLTCA